MNEDHLPELSESEKEEIQKEAREYYPKIHSRGVADKLTIQGRNGYIAGASLQLRKAKKREAELEKRIEDAYDLLCRDEYDAVAKKLLEP